MKTPDTTNSIKMLIISLIILTIIFIYLLNGSPSAEMSRFLRVLTALAAAAMSMSLSGSINIGTQGQIQTFAQKSPNITAAGSLAIFIIVYLFDPIG